jgi:hypothetical protein
MIVTLEKEKPSAMRDWDRFHRLTRIYHAFPVLAALSFVALFMGMTYLTKSYVLCGLVAAAAAVALLWRWTLAQHELLRWPCPHCGAQLSSKMSWSYPPKRCPHCSGAIPPK